MKRLLCLAACLLFLLPPLARAEEHKALPACFHVSYTTKDRTIKDKRFVSKDYITTVQSKVDEEINGIVDQFDAEYADKMKPAGNPKRNSRLDIHVVHTVSGESAVSFLVLARDVSNRKQRYSPFTTRVYDMRDGRLLTLEDLFDQDSQAWDVLAQEVNQQLDAYFPAEKVDADALQALTTRQALLETPFMLGPTCLTLHYEAKALYPKHPTLMHVFIPYQKLAGMMTPYGEKQTDNSLYRMVAITFDDGPAYETSAGIINTLRQYGARATFFIVGNRIAEYTDIVMRENDEMHSLQSHHFVHTDTSKSTVARTQAYTKRFYDAITGAVGTAPIMLRAPYGVFDMFIKAKVNLPLIEWDVDTKDWTSGSSAARVLGKVKELTKPGSIILMHDIKKKTPESAKQVLEWLRNNDYLCVPVEDLFLHYNQDMIPNKIYYRVSGK